MITCRHEILVKAVRKKEKKKEKSKKKRKGKKERDVKTKGPWRKEKISQKTTNKLQQLTELILTYLTDRY